MRRGFQGLSAQVQTVLQQQPFSGPVFVFRGRRGDTIKLLWYDGDGLCLFAKRLERGRFIWPQASEGTVCLARIGDSFLLGLALLCVECSLASATIQAGAESNDLAVFEQVCILPVSSVVWSCRM